MSTIKHRQINFDSKCLLTKNSEQSRNLLPKLSVNELIEKLEKIEQENEIIRRENLLFSRYLIRINSTKTVETFDEYEDENNIILEILDQIKLSNTTRHFSRKNFVKKPKKGTSTWTKLSINWHDYYMYASRIEQERLSIAAYEVKQAYLERERMKTNANITLDNLEVIYQTIETDEIIQKILNRDIERYIKKYISSINKEELNNFDVTFPVKRINKHINSLINLIGLLRVNTTHQYTRIGEINTRICFLDDLNNKMDKGDIPLMNTKKIDSIKTYENLNRIYKKEKFFQYSLIHHLQKWENDLNEQELIMNDIKNKSNILQNHLEKIIIEISCLQQEYQNMLKENQILKNRIDCIIKSPTVIDYARVIQQTKTLQHQIDTWIKRVKIAEMLLLKMNQPTRILPPLQFVITDQH